MVEKFESNLSLKESERYFSSSSSEKTEDELLQSFRALGQGKKLSIEKSSFSEQNEEESKQGLIERFFGHGSALGTTFSLLLAILGSGILTLPSSMHYSGMGLGLILLLIGSFFSYFSCYILSLACHRSGKYSYIQLAKEMGKSMEVFVKIVFCLNNFGCIVIYTLLVDFPHSLLPYQPEAHFAVFKLLNRPCDRSPV